ncbi:MAG: beta-lactamase family protein [Aquisalinus sp.]|nr:beta-lactamase family protein [Aquisalinus sp.]
MLRITLVALGALVVGALAGVGIYRTVVPFPHDAVARGVAFEPENAVWLYQHMSEVFPTRHVARAESSEPFPVAEGRLQGFTYTHNGETYGLDAMFDNMETTGLLVLHRGNIVYEQYGRGADAGTLFATYSAVKSITSTLVGFALGDGLIASVEDPLEKYIPDLTGTAYEGVSIRHALQMSSGVLFDTDGAAGEDTVEVLTQTMVLGNKRINEMSASYPRAHAPGTVFNYNTSETQILLWLVKEVTGKQPAKYLEEKMWRRLGMAHDAAWNIDNPGPDGMEIGGAFFNASLRDLARFGLFIEQDGMWNGEQLLPAGWVDEATRIEEPHLSYGEVFEGFDSGYGYQWWVFPDGSFRASGAYGQTIYIDRENDLVVARTSAWPEGYVAASDQESRAAFTALAEFLNR